LTAIAIARAFVHLMQFCNLLELDYVYRNDDEDFSVVSRHISIRPIIYYLTATKPQ
jgi:hypothetical protein